MTTTTIYDCERTERIALQHARGTYQAALLRGDERPSGSTLRGRARSYAGRYMRSRDALIGRLNRAGFNARLERRLIASRWNLCLVVSGGAL